MHDQGDEPGRRAALRKSFTPLPPGVPRVKLPSGKLATPVATMMLLRTRDWMQELLDHHVPPLTREDVVVFGLIDCVGVIDRIGNDVTSGLPYPSIYDTAQAVYIVAAPLLIEVGWLRGVESLDERLMAILRHAQPWLGDLQQVLAQSETVRCEARAQRLRALHRHRRTGAAARNQALTETFATMRRLIEEDRRAIAHVACDRGYIPRADPDLVQTELLLTKPAAFDDQDGNGWPLLHRHRLLRHLRWLNFPDAQDRARLRWRLREQIREHRRSGKGVTAPTALVPLEDLVERGHDPAVPDSSIDHIIEMADDLAARLKKAKAPPRERSIAYAIALRGARSVARAARMLGIAPSTGGKLMHRLRRRLTV
jgi:hypothetical protein